MRSISQALHHSSEPLIYGDISMVITNTEHPPAAATALGIVTGGWSVEVVIFILLSAVSLAIIRRLLRGYLRDLF